MEARQRLTITLKKDLLPYIDAIIDGEKIRNRSHAIEYLLMQTLKPGVKTAIVLAGGKGLKMRPFTYEMPKTMIPVRGKPILEHTIELLRQNGIKEVIIVTGYLGEKIKSHFQDGGQFGVKITYHKQKSGEDTGKILKDLKKYLNKDPFLLIYGDVLADIDLQDFVSFHSTTGGLGTVALTSIKDPSSYGVVDLKGNKVVGFSEKPQDKKHSHLISSGIFIFDPEVLSQIPNKKDAKLEEDVLPKLAKEGKLFGYSFEGKWFDIGTPEVYEKVIKEWKT